MLGGMAHTTLLPPQAMGLDCFMFTYLCRKYGDAESKELVQVSFSRKAVSIGLT